MAPWTTALRLNSDRSAVEGSAQALCSAIRRGADLRVYTEFRHNEHIDTASNNPELIQEAADFRVTYLVEDRWAAGIINLRQPIDLPHGFGPRASMSFFLYNQDGHQGIARPYLDGVRPASSTLGPCPAASPRNMPKYHVLEAFDEGTNAPSSSFIYDFDLYRFCVCDNWRQVLAHQSDGTVASGCVDDLVEAFRQGAEVKVAVRGLCADLDDDPTAVPNHEVFIHCGSCYHYTQRKLFCAASHPLVRVRAGIPMRYESGCWDFGWLMLRSDGQVAGLLYNPYDLTHRRTFQRHALRWFVR